VVGIKVTQTILHVTRGPIGIAEQIPVNQTSMTFPLQVRLAGTTSAATPFRPG